jgi:hypothetical protein
MTYVEKEPWTGGNADINEFLHPAWTFEHPRDVVNDRDLSLAEKRAILSSWASDACAVESAPGLRQPPGARHAVTFDEIVNALQRLDDPPPRPGGARARPLVWAFGAGSAPSRPSAAR